jgi:hypothetical protein
VASRDRERPRSSSFTASWVEEIMFVRACGGLCVMRGAATSPKWDHSLEPLFDEPSRALVQRTAVEKRIGSLV